MSKSQNNKANIDSGSTSELRRTSSFDRTWEETVAESVANELVLQSMSSSENGPIGLVEQQDDSSKNKSKDPKALKSGRSSHEEKKVAKTSEEKRSRPRKMMEFHNIKISQVNLISAIFYVFTFNINKNGFGTLFYVYFSCDISMVPAFKRRYQFDAIFTCDQHMHFK